MGPQVQSSSVLSSVSGRQSALVSQRSSVKDQHRGGDHGGPKAAFIAYR
jgi:hypothetical protein